MYLADVQLVPSTSDRTLAGQLMASWRHVEDILRAHLPRNWDVAGAGKLVIELFSAASPEPHWTVTEGITTLHRGGFDAADYLSHSPPEQESAALALLEEGLRSLCERAKVPVEPGLEAIAKTAACGFRLRFPLRKLTKSHASRRWKAEILVTYSRGGTGVSLRVTHRPTGRITEDNLLSGAFWPTVWFDYFRSRWEGDTFVVYNRVNREMLRRQCAV